MNKSEMLKKLKFRYARYGVQKQDVENIFNGVLELIVEALASGENDAIKDKAFGLMEAHGGKFDDGMNFSVPEGDLTEDERCEMER